MTARAGGAALRRQVRTARRSLSPAERAAKDAAIRRHIRALPAFRAARRISLFFSFDGEPDLAPLIDFGRRIEYFAPVIAGEDMHFAAIRPDTELAPNRFGIPEPRQPELIDPRALDVVLAPLVAFDDCGNRIGVGGGFYDRCFHFLLQRSRWHKPKLIGTAYALQQIDSISPNSWDVPLWGAVTEDGPVNFD